MNNTTDTSRTAALLEEISSVLWYVVPPVFLMVGTFGNVMIVVVMQSMRSSRSTACLSLYFTALAVSDQCQLLVSSFWFWIDGVFSWPPSFFSYDLFCTVPLTLFYICPMMSAWFLVAMTYQRVTSVVAPLRVGVLCSVRTGKLVIATVGILACAVNLHILFTFGYRRERTECIFAEKYENFIYLFTWLDMFWTSVIPFVLIIVGNSVLIWHVIKSMSLSRKMRMNLNQEGSDNEKVYSMTTTLILTSTVFLILSLPICIFDTYRRALELDITDDNFRAVLSLVETVCLFLWSSATASNFYLYLLSGSKFRQETKRCLRCFRT